MKITYIHGEEEEIKETPVSEQLERAAAQIEEWGYEIKIDISMWPLMAAILLEGPAMSTMDVVRPDDVDEAVKTFVILALAVYTHYKEDTDCRDCPAYEDGDCPILAHVNDLREFMSKKSPEVPEEIYNEDSVDPSSLGLDDMSPLFG